MYSLSDDKNEILTDILRSLRSRKKVFSKFYIYHPKGCKHW
jgi:hypothetical protein